MEDFLAELLGGLFEVLLDGAVELTARSKRRRYIVFSLICLALLVIAAFAGWFSYRAGRFGLAVLCAILSVMVLLVWVAVTVRRKRSV